MVGGRGENLPAGESNGKSAMKVGDLFVALNFDNVGAFSTLCLNIFSGARRIQTEDQG